MLLIQTDRPGRVSMSFVHSKQQASSLADLWRALVILIVEGEEHLRPPIVHMDQKPGLTL